LRSQTQPSRPAFKMPRINKFSDPSRKGKKPATAQEPEPQLPAHTAFKEADYDDDEVIRDFHDLLTRTCRVWNDGTFDPNMMNGGTGALFKSGHHDTDGGPKTRRAFSNGTFAFCLEWISVECNGKLYRVRCQNQFCVRSDQCYTHPRTVFKDGPNRVLSMLDRGDTVTWGMIRDSETLAPLTDEQAKAKAQSECDGLQLEVDRLDREGEENAELLAELAVRKKALFDWTPVPAIEDPALENRANRASGAILNSRRGASSAAPGNPALDAKAKRHPNDKRAKRGKTGLDFVEE